MDPLALVPLARTLIDIDSTSGREGDCGRWLAAYLRARGYRVEEQPVSDGRANVFATLDPPVVVLSTHFDCVPPFFPSRLEGSLLYGRGSCDAKGILAAQITAAERLRAEGMRQIGLLFVVGEERGSDGARIANAVAPGSRFLINGEPTDSRLAAATRGAFRVRLTAKGRAAHSSYPEAGESAIEKLLDALMRLRPARLPSDPLLGTTHYTVGLISGGIAPNVVPPHAEAELMFRTVGPASDLTPTLDGLRDLVEWSEILEIPAARLKTVEGFDTAVFPFTTDVAFLTAWGVPLLYGPGSILVAHTDEEHVAVEELHAAVDGYMRLVKALTGA
ncbi:MAG TPA: M20/M25/M40 family metallo-hydrolase [Vicinamibacterales bacterium]|nr:M20/M25/M40 family metallo-hydrolase [Vicinamibacterales bacterium]